MNAKIIDKRVKLEKPLIFGGDLNSNFINFEIAKTVNGISLANLKVFIKTLNALGGHSKVELESVESGDNLLIEWVLGVEATAVCGEVQCQMCFENPDGSLVMNLQPFTITVENSVSDFGEGVNVSSLSINLLQNTLNEQIKIIARLEGEVENLSKLESGLQEKIDNGVQSAMQNYVDSTINYYEFENLKTAINEINYYNKTKLKAGDVIRFFEYGVPHLWVYKVDMYSIEQYDTLTVSEVEKMVKNKGYIQIGYYKFKILSSSGDGEVQLPEVNASHNGNVLTVVDGKWQSAKIIQNYTLYDGEYE